MVPAKELAEQIYEEARIFAESGFTHPSTQSPKVSNAKLHKTFTDTGVSVARSYGDMQMYRSMLSIKLGCDILVLTSGRLMHHIKANHVRSADMGLFNPVH